MVPKAIRDAIWLHYRPGQEDDKRPSREYLEAAKAAIVYVARLEGQTPDTRLYDFFLARTHDRESIACWKPGCYLAVLDELGTCEVHGLPPKDPS